MKKPRSDNNGFTLIELMMAAVLSAIVVIAAGSLVMGLWKQHTRFQDQTITMNEIQILQNIFNEKCQTSFNINDTNDVKIIFKRNDITSTLKYRDSDNSIVYDPDIDTLGDSIELLKGAVIDGITTGDTTNNVREIVLKIIEQEINKTNTYIFKAQNRNKGAEL